MKRDLTTSPIASLVAETRASMARDRAFALFCDRYASTWVYGNHLFAYPKWEMRVDREWESAVNVLQRNGYKV
jgi:hypothetical protein